MPHHEKAKEHKVTRNWMDKGKPKRTRGTMSKRKGIGMDGGLAEQHRARRPSPTERSVKTLNLDNLIEVTRCVSLRFV